MITPAFTVIQNPLPVLCIVVLALTGCTRQPSPAPAQWRDMVFVVGTSETGSNGSVVASGFGKAYVRALTAGTDLGGGVHTPDAGRHLISDQRTVTEVSATGITVEVRIVYSDDYSTVTAPQKTLKKTITLPYGESTQVELLPTVYIEAHFQSPP